MYTGRRRNSLIRSLALQTVYAGNFYCPTKCTQTWDFLALLVVRWSSRGDTLAPTKFASRNCRVRAVYSSVPTLTAKEIDRGQY